MINYPNGRSDDESDLSGSKDTRRKMWCITGPVVRKLINDLAPVVEQDVAGRRSRGEDGLVCIADRCGDFSPDN